MTLFATCNGHSYPYKQFSFYSKREAVRRYKEEFGLRYKRDVVMWEWFYGVNMRRIK